MISIVWHTFAGDGECLLQSLRAARYHAPTAKLTVVEDAAAPLNDENRRAARAWDIDLRRSHWDRCGNLNGLINLEGQLEAFAEAEGRASWTIKIDCDTVLNQDPATWIDQAAPEHRAICAWQPSWWFQGPCYALRSGVPRTLRVSLAGALPHLAEPAKTNYPEDVSTAHLIAHIWGPDSILALPGYSVSPIFAGHHLAHYQYRSWPAWDTYAGYSIVSFGTRGQLPPQMPDSVKRLTAARTMARFLDHIGLPG